jgi:hypothetical protein
MYEHVVTKKGEYILGLLGCREFQFMGYRYVEQFRVCNKVMCKCHNGGEDRHGPYWYKNNTEYIGKVLPAELLVSLAQLDRKQEWIKKQTVILNKKRAVLAEKLSALDDELDSFESLLHGGFVDDDFYERNVK